MRHILSLIVSLSCLLPAPAFGQAAEPGDTAFVPNVKPVLAIARTDKPVQVDGVLTDAAWQTAMRATNFGEVGPGDNIAPKVRTEAMIAYDDVNLYVAVVCEDDPRKIRATFSERDEVYDDDNIGFFFDTFGEGTWAYVLNVNAHGVQCDALWSRSAGEDASFDMIWESAGKTTASGYQVELAIPFRSLRFPDKQVQIWRATFWRHRYREVHYQMSWTKNNRAEQCWACQWGTLTGITDVKPGRGVELLSSATASQRGALRNSESPLSGFHNEAARGELSLGAKYAISSSLLAEVTVNPDFSQIEADAAQIQVNSTDALYFQERRPFFQEGMDLFTSPLGTVYTRMINDPQLAAKVTSQGKRTSLAALSAIDEHTPMIIPSEEWSLPVVLGRSVVNIARLRQKLRGDSYLGFIGTDRRFDGGGSNTLIGSDGQLRLLKSLELDWESRFSYTEEPTAGPDVLVGRMADASHTAALDGESYSGYDVWSGLVHSGHDYNVQVDYAERTSTQRAATGYFTSNNFRRIGGQIWTRIDLEQGLLQRIDPSVSHQTKWNFSGIVKSSFTNLSLSWYLRAAQASLHTAFETRRENYRGKGYPGLGLVHQCANFRPAKWLSAAGSINCSRVIAKYQQTRSREISGYLEIDIMPFERLMIGQSIEYKRGNDAASGTRLYRDFIYRNEAEMYVSKQISFRIIGQYQHDTKGWGIDPLLTYRLNPFSVVYIGSTYDYRRFDGLMPDYSDRTTLTERQFFCKLQYLFQI